MTKFVDLAIAAFSDQVSLETLCKLVEEFKQMPMPNMKVSDVTAPYLKHAITKAIEDSNSNVNASMQYLCHYIDIEQYFPNSFQERAPDFWDSAMGAIVCENIDEALDGRAHLLLAVESLVDRNGTKELRYKMHQALRYEDLGIEREYEWDAPLYLHACAYGMKDIFRDAKFVETYINAKAPALVKTMAGDNVNSSERVRLERQAWDDLDAVGRRCNNIASTLMRAYWIDYLLATNNITE